MKGNYVRSTRRAELEAQLERLYRHADHLQGKQQAYIDGEARSWTMDDRRKLDAIYYRILSIEERIHRMDHPEVDNCVDVNISIAQ